MQPISLKNKHKRPNGNIILFINCVQRTLAPFQPVISAFDQAYEIFAKFQVLLTVVFDQLEKFAHMFQRVIPRQKVLLVRNVLEHVERVRNGQFLFVHQVKHVVDDLHSFVDFEFLKFEK